MDEMALVVTGVAEDRAMLELLLLRCSVDGDVIFVSMLKGVACNSCIGESRADEGAVEVGGCRGVIESRFDC